MKKSIVLPIIMVTASLIGSVAFAEKAAVKNVGEAKFKEHCALCHPEGGDIVNPAKTLHKKDRDAHGVKSEADIIKLMRKPGPGMTSFDPKAVSDKDAGEIAKYILKTFK